MNHLDEDEDIVPQEMLDAVTRLDPEEFDVAEMMNETILDLDQIVQFLEEAKKFEPKHDDKLKKLGVPASKVSQLYRASGKVQVKNKMPQKQISEHK